MSLLTLVQNVCIETGWSSSPTAVLSSSDAKIQQLRILAEKALREARRRYWFTQLMREHTFATVADQAAYALPDDWDFELYRTHFNRSSNDFIYGPFTPQQWQYVKSYSATNSLDQTYRIKGWANKRFFLDPTPSSAETLVFEYASRNTIRPRTWEASQTYSAGAYTWYDGSIYKTTSGGTTAGSGGPDSDTGITDWSEYTGLYEAFIADTDEVQLEQDVIERGVKALFKQAYRFDGWQEDLSAWYQECEMLAARNMASSGVRTDKGGHRPWPNVPFTGISDYSDS